MSITEPREPYKISGSFEYPEYYEKFQKAIASVWRPEEVSMAHDVYDWQEATPEEKAEAKKNLIRLDPLNQEWKNLP